VVALVSGRVEGLSLKDGRMVRVEDVCVFVNMCVLRMCVFLLKCVCLIM
jgi:hypothetical protein